MTPQEPSNGGQSEAWIDSPAGPPLNLDYLSVIKVKRILI